MRVNLSLYNSIAKSLLKFPKIRVTREHPVETFSKAMRRAYMNMKVMKSAGLDLLNELIKHGGVDMYPNYYLLWALLRQRQLEKQAAAWPWLIGAGLGTYALYKLMGKFMDWAEKQSGAAKVMRRSLKQHLGPIQNIPVQPKPPQFPSAPTYPYSMTLPAVRRRARFGGLGY